MSWERSGESRYRQKDRRPAASAPEPRSIERVPESFHRNRAAHEMYAPDVKDEAAQVSVRGDTLGVPIRSLHEQTLTNDMWERSTEGHWAYMLEHGLPQDIRKWLQSLAPDSALC